jgi:hypothetical protein
VAPVVFLTLIATTKPHLAFGKVQGILLVDALSILLVVAVQTLRAVVIGYTYIDRGVKDKQVYASSLVQKAFSRFRAIRFI